MTGVTGFIGEQLLWKILTELPDTRAAVLVRRKRSAAAWERMVGVVKKDIFNEVREAAGGPEQLLQARVDVIEGDLPNVPNLPPDIDIVVHCAGDVSFDPPIDQAFTTNVIGTKALMDRMIEACSDDEGNLVKIPHYVHISTAYTAGRRRGAIPEAHQVHTIDYDAEIAAGPGDARPAGHRVAYVGPADEAAQGGRARASPGWLPDRRRPTPSAADRSGSTPSWSRRAPSARVRLGWTDVYTFTKALGERVVAPTSVPRRRRSRSSGRRSSSPSWKHPYPGWIEGFKIAEPLILAYGRGELPEFPASPGLGGRHRPRSTT